MCRFPARKSCQRSHDLESSAPRRKTRWGLCPLDFSRRLSVACDESVKAFIFLLWLTLAAPALVQTQPLPPPPDENAQPPGPPPSTQSPPPATPAPLVSQPIEPAQANPPPPPAPSNVKGEWVDTAQYGWIWIPYDSSRHADHENAGSGTSTSTRRGGFSPPAQSPSARWLPRRGVALG